MTGHVSLVGAGPGDPDLLTVRAVRRLGEADVVLYDALAASTQTRALAPEARWFYVGKRAGRPSISQETINKLLIRSARRGQCVVRLKCGDPFVLGRGGEEALALAAAGIPFEVIPGVTSAVAAPALAGIPVTHRGLAAAFVVASGHDEASYGPIVDSVPGSGTTLVVLMGLRTRAAIASRLIARGWDAATPAAIVTSASTPSAWRWVGRLNELGAVELPPEVAGVLVIGAVASLATEIAPELGLLESAAAHAAGGR